MLLNDAVIEKIISEPSSDTDASTFIVRGIHYRAYERGEVSQPSTFICECDTEEMAKDVADTLNRQINGGCKHGISCPFCGW